MNKNALTSFQTELKTDLDSYTKELLQKYPAEDLIKIDLHCHDCNSNEPDELLGRILNVPETWISTKRVLEELKKNGCTAYTITNHNNARSCYEQQAQNKDILTAAEFSCWVPDDNIGIHVLAYGFTQEQEIKLNKLRKNVFHFQQFTCENDIPTIWAHPLYHYATGTMPPAEFFDKMLLIFERFEMLNGQRDTWQNMLVKEWITSVTPAKIDQLSQKYGIDPSIYCRDIYKKSLSGGSDSHTGFFSGLTGTHLYIPDLQKRLKTTPLSLLSLEAVKRGDMIPFGSHHNSEKLTIALLDYVCQIALNYKDPGLMRLLLHKGKMTQKVLAMVASNAFAEVQLHKVTISFINIFHNCMLGKPPSFLKKYIVSTAYKPIFDEVVKMSRDYHQAKNPIVEEYYHSICQINKHLNEVLFARLQKKLAKAKWVKQLKAASDLERIVGKLELPSRIRAYTDKKEGNKNSINISELLDGLTFPFFASLLVLSAHFTGARVLYNTRPFLKQFSDTLGKYQHPVRALWLTDTFVDKNGVSVSLHAMLHEIRTRNLPIDMLVCSDTLESEDHLIVVKPIVQFSIPLYAEQAMRIPNLVEIHNYFQQGDYDRVICSTEGVMGLMALYLKNAYSVPAYFYIHTDWVMFCRKVLNFDRTNQSRIRRILRTFYGAFDKVFVLNTDQQKWLTSREMNFPEDKVCLTAHWTDPLFMLKKETRMKILGIENHRPLMLYVGRISKEKGVLDLPDIYRTVRKQHPEVALLVVGRGPASAELKAALPEVQYLDWVEHEKLPAVYSVADILVFPSKFDTFACVVLESLCCGLPVIAYSTKGPKDIIVDDMCGYLVKTKEQMINKLNAYFDDPELMKQLKKAAEERAKDYHVDKILATFLKDIDLDNYL
ncbi:MAG: glycosyltransferase [Candidatus Cloacimonetes bacterium]|nr:glycosyltransferase [Candidatus Cloacimonadota bacterium]